MNSDQIAGVLRAVLPAILAFMAGLGWLSQDQVTILTAAPFIAALVTVGAAVWSVISNTVHHKLRSVVNDPSSVAVAKAMPVTPGAVAVANALKTEPKT